MAEFCIAAVLRSIARRSVLEVGGPEALTPLEVVRIFEEESGRRFEVETIPDAKLREQLNSANDSLEKSFAGVTLLTGMTICTVKEHRGRVMEKMKTNSLAELVTMRVAFSNP